MSVAIAEMQAELLKLKAENEALKAKRQAGLIVKRSDKSDAIMVIGVRKKFPISFYAEEWEQLFSLQDKIRAAALLPVPVRVAPSLAWTPAIRNVG